MTEVNTGLIEGKDYKVEEGLYVWTADYLQNRGYCCDNGCRNCPYEFLNDKKVASFVPSWTNTLIECGVEVVGRTKFCIHPVEIVSAIPVLGGTKNLKTDRLDSIDADLVILDKQENPVGFLAQIRKPVYASDVNSVESLFTELVNLNKILLNKKLNELIVKLEKIISKPVIDKDLNNIPGVIQWLNPIHKHIDKVLYIIWREPWMCVSKNTFIASMLEHLGFGGLIPDFDTDYPEISLQEYDPDRTLLLFSSEPYPFHKKIEEIRTLTYPSAIVDGESYSWFGISAITFLEENK